MRKVLVTLLVLCVACVPVGDLDGAPSPTTPPPVPATAPPPVDLAQPELTSVDCPAVEVPDGAPPGLDPRAGVRCGIAVLPEDRTDARGPVIELAWTMLEAVPPPEETADEVPLVVLADGPGDAMTEEVLGWLDSPHRRERDILLVDARGAGRSFPSLDCGVPPAPGDLPLDLVEDCRRALTAAGVHLSTHDTAAMAADVVDLAAALSLPRIHLLGIGHGGRVGLQVLRSAPDLLASLVLDSPLPHEVDVYGDRAATAQAALNRLLDECAESASCAAQGEAVRDGLGATIRALDRSPVEGPDGQPVSGQDLVRSAMAAMRGADGPAQVPAALALVVADQPVEAVARLREAAVSGATVPTSTFAEGLLLSSDCRDEVPFGRSGDDGSLEAFGEAVQAQVTAVLEACALWDVTPAAAAASRPVEGDVPTLVLTGEFDPLSPGVWGAAVAARLDRGQVVQVDGAGHRVHDADNCTLAIVAEFLRRPGRTVNDACARDRVVDFSIG